MITTRMDPATRFGPAPVAPAHTFTPKDAQLPMLALRPALATRPSCVVAAVDFSPASIRAARLARSLMADSGTLYLTFVDSGEFRGTGSSATGLHHVGDRGIDAVFADLVEALGPTPGVTITPVIR